MSEHEPTRELLDWTELVQVTWVACRAEREAQHRRVGGRCGTRHIPYSPADSTGERVDDSCRQVGCLDLVHDLAIAAHEKLARSDTSRVTDPHGYAHRTVSTLLIERRRAERVAIGLPAKPGRPDGKPALVVEALTSRVGADTPQAQWFEALFRMMRDYAHRTDRETTRWPIDGWTIEKSRYDGVLRPISNQTQAEINRDINEVLKTARELLGPAWVHSTIYHPLVALLRPVDSTQLETSRSQAPEDILLRRWLAQEYGRLRTLGTEPTMAFNRATRTVLGVAPPSLTVEIKAILRDLDEDLGLAG